MPLAYLGGVCTTDSLERIMNEGFDLVTLGRALIKDTEMINKI